MANNKVRITVDKKAIAKWVNEDPVIKDILITEAHKVANEAAATASEAENGAGGTLTGYAAAGFDVVYKTGTKRPKVYIVSKAEEALALAVHFYTQRRDGIGHLRAALYKFTKRNNVTIVIYTDIEKVLVAYLKENLLTIAGYENVNIATIKSKNNNLNEVIITGAYNSDINQVMRNASAVRDIYANSY